MKNDDFLLKNGIILQLAVPLLRNTDSRCEVAADVAVRRDVLSGQHRGRAGAQPGQIPGRGIDTVLVHDFARELVGPGRDCHAEHDRHVDPEEHERDRPV